MKEIIDTHSHFNLRQFDTDREEAIARMEAEGVSTICIGIDYETSVVATELAEKYKSIWAIVGQHPTEWCKTFEPAAFEALLKKDGVIGIGECGLDYYRERERGEKEKQKELFENQIKIAGEYNLPLMLHIRPPQGTMDAYEDALMILKKWKEVYPNLTGTSHFFVGDNRIAQEFLDLGFYISFAGPITFALEYESVIKMVPLNRMLVETDAPFAAPVPYRGQRCEPWHVKEVVKKISEVREVPIEKLKQQLIENTKRLFNV